jgi:putative N6-adenine-specific DNA methylase
MIHRKKGEFAFERLLGFNRNLWREVQDQARLERLEEPKHPIWASDISGSFVDMAQTHALAARVEKHINFSKGRFQDQKPFAPKGLIVSNLPFGERLEKDSLEDLAATYKEIGDCLKHNFSGWRCALLAAVESPFKAIGLKPSRKIPIKNGSIECRLLLYDLYDGSRR